jgi:hypothetical protein
MALRRSNGNIVDVNERRESRMNAAILDACPAILDEEPARTVRPRDELRAYVAAELANARRLFDILGDAFVLDRVDEYLSVLDHLARDPTIRGLLAADSPPEAVGAHAYRLAA